MSEIIKQEIKISGKPMSLSRFMELGLLHPEFGYYSTKEKIFSKGGDFVTSPEISQMFGESLGIWMVAALQNNYGGLANPKERFSLVEIGPGSGLMMSDVLRTLH
jgi:NADH dehydrogenase [ubiquinone] 1 alpha subcomplex assembly factor 7